MYICILVLPTHIHNAIYLHATDTNAEVTGRGRVTLVHLTQSLLVRRIVPVLARAHLEVQYTRQFKVHRQVLQKNEFYLRYSLSNITSDLKYGINIIVNSRYTRG